MVRTEAEEVVSAPEVSRVRLRVDGMHCASCVGRVETALGEVAGVSGARVNLLTAEAMVDFTGAPDPEAAAAAVAAAGYTATPITDESAADAEKAIAQRYEEALEAARRRTLIAWGLTLPLLLMMLAHTFGSVLIPGQAYLEIALALAALVWPGRPIFVSAWKSTRALAPNMDALIALGSGAAALTAPITLFVPHGHSHAMMAAMLIAFNLSGRYLEARARGRASRAIHALLELGAKTARVLREDTEVEIPASEILQGDIFIVRPGERLAADGEVVAGESAVDESLATGEALPVDKCPGDIVLGGTINTSGALRIRATRVGEEAFLAQVARVVRDAQVGKPPIQAFADRMTVYFVPIILVIALLTFAFWAFAPGQMQSIGALARPYLPWPTTHDEGRYFMALQAAIAVLVISCPCAMGLATPTAVLVGTGWAAQHGILFRDGTALQALCDARIFCFDKTGTLTLGKPKVVDVRPAEKVDKRALLRIAAAVERGSEHPLAAAIVAEADALYIPRVELDSFSADAGLGARGEIDGVAVFVGKPAYIEQQGISLKPIEQLIYEWSQQARTSVVVAQGAQILGAFALSDTIKPDAIRAVKILQRMRLRTLVISGDRQEAVRVVAEQVGIKEVIGDVLPQDKAERVARLRKETIGQVAMVGDGVNDAGALAAAGVGVAMGAGSDIAIEAAGVTLVRGNLLGLVHALLIARATYHKIQQNLGWAIGYNLIAVPLAIAGLLHPVVAEVCMALSSLTVIANSMRLKHFRPDPVISEILRR